MMKCLGTYVSGLIILGFIINKPAYAQSAKAFVTQSGFYTNGPKTIILTHAKANEPFGIIDLDTRQNVFAGRLTSGRKSPTADITGYAAEFSALKKNGYYAIQYKGQNLDSFYIQPAVYHALSAGAIKSYYYQRASMPLLPQYAGKWHRGAGHPDTIVYIHPSALGDTHPAGARIKSPGGWYDAGDYNKYIVNAGITMGTLLTAYEDFSGYYDTLSLNIPESGNGIPDIINEIIYNLRWMLTMQDTDGGVFTKCTNAAFDGMVMPGITKDKRYVVKKSTAATLDFAAVTAQAARIMKAMPGLRQLSDSCLTAANKAWQWAIKNPKLYYDQDAMNKQYQPAITTGGYGDKKLEDEWFWAAAELYITTRDTFFLNYAQQYWQPVYDLQGWPNVGMMGCYTLLKHATAVALPESFVSQLKQRLWQLADEYLAVQNKTAFATVMGYNAANYSWGSNAVAANQAMLLIKTYLLNGQTKYVHAALTNLEYLTGRNATEYSFITGFGKKTPMYPHHRPSAADGITEPVPGFLVGGPNRHAAAQDKCVYNSLVPELQYTDAACSFASNEIAINWNAPLVYITGAMESIKYQLQFND
ncbi:glycoside hydrolase family 9 protein [Terrimonas rubra]|uniref:Endoglucanase n=1 Tax=Terrimonas rubra TaxID=1035890 RepID=A0ABW6A6V8_9BACT